MKYRDILGFSEKQPKKKVVKEIKKPSLVDTIKQELNEWNDETFKNKPKRWSSTYGKSLTEFEKQGGKDSVNEGPAYEYSNQVKKIEKAENMQSKEVNNLVKLLGKKGLKREATDLASNYMKSMRNFNDFMKKMMRKLV